MDSEKYLKEKEFAELFFNSIKTARPEFREVSNARLERLCGNRKLMETYSRQAPNAAIISAIMHKLARKNSSHTASLDDNYKKVF